jgi:hypothetical protein
VSDSPKRTIIKGGAAHLVSRVTNTSSMLDGALKVLAEQLDHLAVKSRFNNFDEKEAKILQGYIRSLVELSKEEREREKSTDLSNLTLEQLIEAATNLQQKSINKPE